VLRSQSALQRCGVQYPHSEIGVGPCLKGLRSHLIQDTIIVEREISHQALQARVLLFQALQPFGSIDPQPAIFFLPPIVG